MVILFSTAIKSTTSILPAQSTTNVTTGVMYQVQHHVHVRTIIDYHFHWTHLVHMKCPQRAYVINVQGTCECKKVTFCICEEMSELYGSENYQNGRACMHLCVFVCVCICVGGCFDTFTWWPWATSLMANIDSTGLVGLIILQIHPFVAFLDQRNYRYQQMVFMPSFSIHVGCWNVYSLDNPMKQNGRLRDVLRTMKEKSIEILTLSEVR